MAVPLHPPCRTALRKARASKSVAYKHGLARCAPMKHEPETGTIQSAGQAGGVDGTHSRPTCRC